MKWVLLERPRDSDPFLTSDSPALVCNPTLPSNSFHGPGLAQDDIEVSLPLSPDLALMAQWNLIEDRAYIICPSTIVEELNRRVMRNGHTLVSNDRSLLVRHIEIARKVSQKATQGASRTGPKENGDLTSRANEVVSPSRIVVILGAGLSHALRDGIPLTDPLGEMVRCRLSRGGSGQNAPEPV